MIDKDINRKSFIILDEMCNNKILESDDFGITIKCSNKLMTILDKMVTHYNKRGQILNQKTLDVMIIYALQKYFNITDYIALYEYSSVVSLMADVEKYNRKSGVWGI